MWSHYTRSHTGVCLYYEFPPDYFADRYMQVAGPHGDSEELFFVGGSQVYYGDDAFTHWLIRGSLDEPIDGNHIENAVSRIFTSKGADWSYEEEWRLVTSKSGILRFDPAFLKDVTFGLRTGAGDRARIAAIARANNPEVIFRQARKSAQRDFALEFEQVEV